jgi:tryptophanyl-tRNA synthetase
MPLTCGPIKRTLGRQRKKLLIFNWNNAFHTDARHQSNSSISNDSNQVIFSGIQPTGVPHLGNYLGALQQWVHLQNTSSPSTKLLYSIVDLHAITIPQNPGQLKQWRRESLATLMAVGLDEKRCGMFYQSSVRFHDGRKFG